MAQKKSLADSLKGVTTKITDTVTPTEETIEKLMAVPEVCTECACSPICNVLHTMLTWAATLGIVIEIKSCPYFGYVEEDDEPSN